MAETAILAALNALGRALANEVMKLATSQSSELLSVFLGLDSGMRKMHHELELMQSFLNDINMLDHNNGTFETWLNQVRNMACNIQDTVDEFVYLVGLGKLGGKWFYLKKLFKEPKSFSALKRIAIEIRTAEETLQNLAGMKVRWLSNTNAEFGKTPHDYSECSRHEAVSAHFIDEDEVVGIEENRATLTSWLCSGGSNLSVISVWGMGGLGKTTLATNVFNREKKKFDCHAWFSISQTYTVSHILGNLISEICKSRQTVPVNTTTMDLRELKDTLKEFLKEKRCLIVLDDVWDPMAFRDISDVLIDSHKESRIIITSRIAEVAFLAPENHRFELMPLVESESWKLFCRKAFQFQTNHACPLDLEKWATEIVSKCRGLPLALVSMAGMLSLRENNEVEWKRVHDQLSWELEHNPSLDRMKRILNLSFNYLPRNLKNCFLYCCMFPEDHLLARKKIIRLWIAEGFVEEKGLSTLEEVAEGYLVELVRRSMLQLV